jgi:hypothetical protein
MNGRQLPDGHSIEIGRLLEGGTIELLNGLTCRNCEMTGIDLGEYVVDMVPRGGQMTLSVRWKDGRRARFVHDGTHWYEVAPGSLAGTVMCATVVLLITLGVFVSVYSLAADGSSTWH